MSLDFFILLHLTFWNTKTRSLWTASKTVSSVSQCLLCHESFGNASSGMWDAECVRDKAVTRHGIQGGHYSATLWLLANVNEVISQLMSQKSFRDTANISTGARYDSYTPRSCRPFVSLTLWFDSHFTMSFIPPWYCSVSVHYSSLVCSELTKIDLLWRYYSAGYRSRWTDWQLSFTLFLEELCSFGKRCVTFTHKFDWLSEVG